MFGLGCVFHESNCTAGVYQARKEGSTKSENVNVSQRPAFHFSCELKVK